MKVSSRLLAIALLLQACGAVAHTPSAFWLWLSENGGGGGTQNVIAGPIKHRPVNNSPVVPPDRAKDQIGLQPQAGNSHDIATMHVTAIFLGIDWLNPRFRQDKIVGIDQFLRGYPISNYSVLPSEYFSPSADGVARTVQYDGYIVDDQIQLGYREQGGVLPAELAALFRLVDQGRIQLRADGSSYFVVFSAYRRPADAPCAWHGYVRSTTMNFSIVYNLDQDSECTVNDSKTGHSSGLAAIANVTAKALADIRTDYQYAGWQDKTGNEVDDLCAWTFSVPYVTFPDGSKWKLQDLWSNKAYEAGTGAPNAWGQRGCVTSR